MGSFITGNTDLPATKIGQPSTGASPKLLYPEDFNAHRSALLDLRDHTSGWVNVKSYGAKGDGVTDDTAAIQGAVNAALSGKGTEVVFPLGYYRVTGPIAVGLPENTNYEYILNRTSKMTDALVSANTNGANVTANNATISANGASFISLRFADGAFIVADFAPSVITPVIGYHLQGSGNHAGSIINAAIIGAASFSGGKYAQPGSGTGPANKLIGIYAGRGVKVIERPFTSSIQYGVVTLNAYWQRVKDVTCEYAAGDCFNAAQGNAITVDNVLMSYSGRGVVFDGDASQLRAMHSEQIGQDLVIFSADSSVFGPAYFEDVSASDGTGTYAVTLGYQQNGSNVLQSTFIDIRVGSVRPNKQAIRVWDTKNSNFIGSRIYGHGSSLDTASYGTEVGCDFDFGGSQWISLSGVARIGPGFANGTSGGVQIQDAGGVPRSALIVDSSNVLKQGGTGIASLLDNVPRQNQVVFPTYGATVTIDPSQGRIFRINATDGNAFTIANPSNAVAGQIITLEIVNGSGVALGTITWGGNYRLSTWTSPANGYSRVISFYYYANGAKWRQVEPAGVDVPN